MAREVVFKADKVYNRKKRYNRVKVILGILFLFLIFVFIILSIIYRGGKFTISLDRNLANDNNIVIYDNKELMEGKRKLEASSLDFMDNISINWIPTNIDDEMDGSHNGDNYIAYTFYVANNGKEIVDYWYSIVIDDVIKNVDEAVRVMIFLNGEKSVYAKINSYTGKEEDGTVAFFSDKEAVIEERSGFSPGDVDKFTVVIWLEGDDPDCVDSILGGEIKMHMEIREEHNG